MFSALLLALFSSVLLESHASVLSPDDADTATTLRGFSFSAKATPSTDKDSSDNHTLTNEFDMEYTGKVNVGGHDFNLLIDTGSSDLWVINAEKLQLNRTTSTTINLTYGIGSASGTLAYGPVAFGDYRVDAQALLIASKTTDQDGEGILGLGLDDLSVLARTAGTRARSVLGNLFAQHPDAPRCICLALERSDDGEQTAGGTLTVGDACANATALGPRIPVAPPSSARWTIALAGMAIDGRAHALQSGVQGAPRGEAIALVDSGTSLAYIPADAVEAIYGRINGSVHVRDDGQDAWFVPCFGQVNLSLTFGNVSYAINPMELTSPIRVMDQTDQYTVCINAFRPPLDDGANAREFDFLLGDVFMRNVYSVFNVGSANDGNGNGNGNDATNASIQFAARTNPDQVFADFARQRQDSLRAFPPLFDLGRLRPDGTIDGGAGRLQAPSTS